MNKEIIHWNGYTITRTTKGEMAITEFDKPAHIDIWIEFFTFLNARRTNN